jgi:hypothetical protein
VCRETDHNPLILDLKISFSKPVKERVEIYNLKNKECQQIFGEVTSNSLNLSECFSNGNSLKNQVELWKMRFTSAIKKSFKRIRITEVREESDVEK